MLIKTEGLRSRTFTTRADANLALFEYIDGFYNPRRIQKRLGYLRSRISTDHGTCGSNRFPAGVIFPLYAHEDRASR